MSSLIIPDHGERIEYLGFGEEVWVATPSQSAEDLVFACAKLQGEIDEYAKKGWFLRNVITVRVGNEGDALIAFFANGAPPVIVEKPHDE